jgi:dihydroorotate dehydrogenase (fumarate)
MDKISRIETNFKGFKLKSPFINASGPRCTTKEELDLLNDASEAGAFITKTGTLELRGGNPKPRYYYDQETNTSINSMGLPNAGLDFYLDYLVEMQETGKGGGKPLFLSVAPMKPEDISKILIHIEQSAFKGFTELNLSCPNIPGKPQIAYDVNSVVSALDTAEGVFTKPLGIKLPPYFDMTHFDAMSKIFNDRNLSFVNCCNSLGNGLLLSKSGETMVHSNNGFGGIGGDPVYPIALSNVKNFRDRLKPEISIIGTGGVNSGERALAHIRAGADLVGVGTHFQEGGIGVFEDLNKDLSNALLKHGIRNVDEARNTVTRKSNYEMGI